MMMRKNHLLWSWWDSNPRPHKETIRFLHAYSGQDFRATARTGLPTDALSPKISPAHWGLYRLFPIFLHRLIFRFGTTSLERCLVLSPGDGIKPVIYCTSIRQRERSCFRQLNFLSTSFMEIADEAPHAYVPFHLAVKSMSTPRIRDTCCKDTTKN